MTEQAVVLVHGLWMNGLDMKLLKRRMSHTEYHTIQFSYPSINNSPSDNAGLLNEFLGHIQYETIHFVCHSLGGLIVRHLFHAFPEQRPGRVVTLGTPHQPSKAAIRLNKTFLSGSLLGKSIEQGLLGNVPAWHSHNELGVIAGDLSLGLGLLIPGIPRPNDGTVAVEETRLQGMKDHTVIHASHFGLLLSYEAFNCTRQFLSHGVF